MASTCTDPLSHFLLAAAARLDAVGTEWRQRCEAEKAAWVEERARLQEDGEARMAQLRHQQASALEEARQHHRRELARAEAKAAAAAQAADRCGPPATCACHSCAGGAHARRFPVPLSPRRAWQQHLEAAVAKAEGERHAASDVWAGAAVQREQHLMSQLAAAQESAAARAAELDRQWALKVAAAEERALRVRWGAGVG